MQAPDLVNVRQLENSIHWLFALSFINLLATAALALRLRKKDKA